MSTVDRLLSEQPAIHGDAGASDLLTHGLTPGALRFIEQTVRPGHRTLETGAGYSTIVFAAAGATHTCVVPNPPEVERLSAYLESSGIGADAVTFRVEPSERVLPTLGPEPLDLVLIDGSHSFPQVFIDWFYVADKLAVGGHLIVDDVHVWTGQVLRDFLIAEPEWTKVEEYGGRTTVFRKDAEVDPDRVWNEQPYVMRRSRPTVLGRGRMAVSMLRHGQSRELRQMAGDMIRRSRKG